MMIEIVELFTRRTIDQIFKSYTMRNYRIEIKLMNKPSVIGIQCFLIDSEYVPNSPNSSKHMSDALCYIGFIDKIEASVLKLSDINRVWKNEIQEFYKDFNEVIEKLKTIGTPQQVAEMTNTIEAYIRQAILRRFD